MRMTGATKIIEAQLIAHDPENVSAGHVQCPLLMAEIERRSGVTES
jgi:hypothetical protein